MEDTSPEKHDTGTPDEKRKASVFDIDTTGRSNLNAVFENPLADVPDGQLMRDVESFCEKYDLMADIEEMKKGAMISKYPGRIQDADYLSDAEKEVIEREKTHKWDHPFMLYWLCGSYLSVGQEPIA